MKLPLMSAVIATALLATPVFAQTAAPASPAPAAPATPEATPRACGLRLEHGQHQHEEEVHPQAQQPPQIHQEGLGPG